MLKHCRVLIVEDEPFVALDLAHSVEEAHGEVIGPFATVKDGLVYLAQNHAQAAILDVRLADRDITPVALALLGKESVVIFYTSSDIPMAVTSVHGDQPICRKPMESAAVIKHLVKAIEARAHRPV